MPVPMHTEATEAVPQLQMPLVSVLVPVSLLVSPLFPPSAPPTGDSHPAAKTDAARRQARTARNRGFMTPPLLARMRSPQPTASGRLPREARRSNVARARMTAR